jgi:hypothetical protein
LRKREWTSLIPLAWENIVTPTNGLRRKNKSA